MADLGEHLREAAHLAMELPPSEARVALAQAAALAMLLASKAAELAPEAAAPVAVEPPARAEWMNAEQVEAVFGLSKAWLAEHRRDLVELEALARVPNKMLLYKAAKIRAFITGHQLATSKRP